MSDTMRFTERAFFLPDDSMVAWVPSQAYCPRWRRSDWRRRDRDLHPLEHFLQELVMLEDCPQRRYSRAKQNMLEHEEYSPYLRNECSRNARRPERRRYNPYQPAGCQHQIRRPSVQNVKKAREETKGSLIPHTNQGQWRTSLDMRGFKPSDIKVKVENRTVHLSAKSEEWRGSRFAMSEVSRIERLPDDVEEGSVTASLSENGVMHVTANRRPHQSERGELTQSEDPRKLTSKAKDIVVQAGSNGDRTENSAVEDVKIDCAGQSENHFGGTEKEPTNAVSSCIGAEKEDAAQEKSSPNTRYTVSSPTAGIDVSDEPVNKDQEDVTPEIILIHEDTPDAVSKPKDSDDAESEEVMVIDDKGENQEKIMDMEDQALTEQQSSEKDNDTTLAETTTTHIPFKVTLDMSTYDPEDLQVRVSGRQVYVTAERSLQNPDGSTMCRRYAKTFPLPPSADAKSVMSMMTSDGQMTITATSLQQESEERVVAIQRVDN